jgi:hypothetical protein
MVKNSTFYKLSITIDFLNAVLEAKKNLVNELIIFSSDPVKVKRRLRMLKQLSLYESQILDKIQRIDPTTIDNLNILPMLTKEIYEVTHRSA